MKILILLLFSSVAWSGTLLFKDYPHFVLKHNEVIYYCVSPLAPGDIVVCFNSSKLFDCTSVLPKDGYITDCKFNREIKS